MLKHILRLNAVPNNVISATSSSEDVELSHDHYLMDQENLQPRTAYMVREYPPKQIVHSKQLELQSQQQQGHLQEHDDQEWKFPSSTMEDYWQIMDDRVMTYFNKPSTNDANPTTQVYSPRTAVPLPPPYAMSESTEQGNNIASPHPYIDKENIVLSTDISTINSSTFPNQEPVYFEQAPMNMRNMTIVRLHSKPEAPSFRRPPIAVNSTNAPPKKRVRFDCTGSQDCYTESEGRYQSHLQQQMPQPLPNQDGYLHEYIQQWSRNRYIHPMQPLSQFIQQPAINEIEFSQLDQSSAPINRLNSYCDDNTVMFATVSIDSESSQTNTFKGNFEGFGNSVRPTFPEYNTSVYKDADSMDNANVIDGSEDGLHNVSDKGTPFSMAQYFSVY